MTRSFMSRWTNSALPLTGGAARFKVSNSGVGVGQRRRFAGAAARQPQCDRTLLARLLFLVVLLTSPFAVGAQDHMVGVKAMPLIHTPSGVLFQIYAPHATKVYLAGTFNGWAESDGWDVKNERARMFGPNEDGVFEMFVPLTPGRHAFKFCVEGRHDGWIRGDSMLETLEDDFDRQDTQREVGPSSVFSFSLTEPPWPPFVPSDQMAPVVFTPAGSQTSYLRIRFFSRTARSAYVVGSWDGWSSIAYRKVQDNAKAMAQSQKFPYLWQYGIPLSGPGEIQYKIVGNGNEWLSDPSVIDSSNDGNTIVQIVQGPNGLEAQYERRFRDDDKRLAEEYRWSTDIPWMIERDKAYAAAMNNRQKMIWVITMPGSEMSENLMNTLCADPELQRILPQMVCLETPANLVRDVMVGQGIYRVPHVILINSSFQAVFQQFNPTPEEVKQQLLVLP